MTSNATATKVTTQHQYVVSKVTLHGVSLGIATLNIQSVSSTGVGPITVSESFVSRDRLTSGSRSLNGETLSIASRPSVNGDVTQSTVNPDGTQSRTTYQHGLMLTAATLKTDSSVITSTSYTYDSLQRPLTVTDARTGTTSYDLDSNGQADVTESGQPLAIKTPANHITSLSYDIMGRQISSTLPDNSVSYTAYYPTGQVKATWGSQT